MGRIINIIKSTGEKEPLSLEKLLRTLKRAGAGENLANQIAQDIKNKAWSGITTSEVYKMAMRQLRKAHPAMAARYSLRNAIFRLGPAGFEFEKYTVLLLRKYGYKAVLPEILQGKCITHEVDILAEHNGKKMMMECKLRQSTEFFVTIKDTMSTWARFMDLVDASAMGRGPRLDEAWIVTNSKFSYDSLQFGLCKGMGMLSWNTPTEKPLPAWIDEKKLYPITILQNLKGQHLEAFGRAEILVLEDLVKFNLSELSKAVRLPQKYIAPVLEEAKEILEFEPR